MKRTLLLVSLGFLMTGCRTPGHVGEGEPAKIRANAYENVSRSYPNKNKANNRFFPIIVQHPKNTCRFTRLHQIDRPFLISVDLVESPSLFCFPLGRRSGTVPRSMKQMVARLPGVWQSIRVLPQSIYSRSSVAAAILQSATLICRSFRCVPMTTPPLISSAQTVTT